MNIPVRVIMFMFCYFLTWENMNIRWIADESTISKLFPTKTYQIYIICGQPLQRPFSK